MREFKTECTADDEPADLAGAGADLVELAHDPPCQVVVDVTIAAQDMNGIGGKYGCLPSVPLL